MAEITKVIRVGDTLTNLIDSDSKESVNYKKVTTYYDNTPMTDLKVDGELYRKSGNEYFRKIISKEGELFLEKDTMAQLRALTNYEILLLKAGVFKGIKLNGYYTKGDTPAPIEYYLSNTIKEDDGGSVIVIDSIKLEHVFLSETSVIYFGGKVGVDEDSTAFLKRTINYANTNKIKINNYGQTYRIKDVNIDGGYVDIEGGVLLNEVGNGFNLINCDYISIKNLEYTALTPLYGAVSIEIRNSKNVYIIGNRFIKTELGVKVYHSSNIIIENNLVSESTQQGIYIEGCDGCIISKNICRDNAFDGLKMGGVQPPNLKVLNKNITVTGNISTGNGRDGFDIASNNIDGLLIEGNIFRDNTLLGIDAKLVYQGEYGWSIKITNNILSNNIQQSINVQCDDDVAVTADFRAVVTDNHIESTEEIRDIGIRMSGLTRGEVSNNHINGVKTGIRLINSKNLLIRNNTTYCVNQGVLLTSILALHSTSNNFIEYNTFNASTYGVQIGLNISDLGVVNSNIIRRNTYNTATTVKPVLEIGSGVTNTRIYGNIRGTTAQLTPSGLSSINSNTGDIMESSVVNTLGYEGFIYNGTTWDFYNNIKIKQSTAVTNSTTVVPTSDVASTATDIEGLVVDLNDLISKYNTALLVITDLQTKLNAKFTADRTSGQQSIT